MDYKAMVADLHCALGMLYRARHIATGPERLSGPDMYPKMDLETFNEIVHLQSNLSKLISRLEKKDRENE